MWDLPGPGLKPVLPALAGGFLTTAPPGKSLDAILLSRALAIVKASGHSKADTAKAKGNSLVDNAPKQKLYKPTRTNEPLPFPFQPPSNLTDILFKFQRMVPDKEKDTWTQNAGRFNSNTELWIGPKGKPVLLFGAQYPILQYTHELTRWNPDKMVLWRKQYFWKPSFTIAPKVYSGYSPCPKYNPWKPIHCSQGHFPLPVGPSEVCQIGFMQMPPSHGYQYVLVMICTFSHWAEAFPCRCATAQAAGN